MSVERLKQERQRAQVQVLELIYGSSPRSDKTEDELLKILDKIK